MAPKVHYLTPEGRLKLEQELEYLRTVKRAEVARNLKSAIEEGDLSENAGYSESKRDQGMLEGRIADIEAIVANAAELTQISNGDTVALGIKVTVVEAGQDPETYQIVGAAEADPTRGRISNESPLGRALMGHRAGEIVEVQAPAGVLAFEISSVG